MDVKLWEIASLVGDAADCLRDASRKAMRASGSEPGREPSTCTVREPCPACGGTGYERPTGHRVGPWPECPACAGKAYYEATYSDPGEPAVEGWPAMDAFADLLGKLAEQVAGCIPAEIAGAIKAEKEEDDHMSDLADAASY